MCVISDMNGLSMSNFDYQMFWKKKKFQCLQEMFGDLFGEMYIVNIGWVFRSLWYIVSKFVSAKLKEKVSSE